MAGMDDDCERAALRAAQRSFYDRIACWEDTKRIAAAAPPPLESTKLAIRPGERCEPRFTVPTQLLLCDEDSIDCGLELDRRLWPGTAVLNLADDVTPGGCVGSGSGAQEESLFRRTNLCRTLVWRPDLYPILEGEAVYSPHVTVFKASEQDGWAPLDPPRALSFLTVPGVKYPRLAYEDDGRGGERARLRPEDADSVRTRVRAALVAAYAKGHHSVVLGAMGCGAWRCPGAHVAELFAEVLPEFRGAFRTVALAIKRGAGDVRAGNFELFRAALFPGAAPGARSLSRDL